MLRMGYEFDVFLSYTTDYPFGDWVHEHFRPLFEGYLNNDLGRRARIFVDRDNIAPGEAWPERLARSLADSCCLVAIWSPSYFASTWCKNECAVMVYRENQLGYRTIKNPRGLILPVIVHDGESFPEFAKRMQSLNCKDFARIGEGFKKTERYVEFQDRIIPWSREVANIITHAPTWQPKWREDTWINEAINNFPVPEHTPAFPLPVLE